MASVKAEADAVVFWTSYECQPEGLCQRQSLQRRQQSGMYPGFELLLLPRRCQRLPSGCVTRQLSSRAQHSILCRRHFAPIRHLVWQAYLRLAVPLWAYSGSRLQSQNTKDEEKPAHAAAFLWKICHFGVFRVPYSHRIRISGCAAAGILQVTLSRRHFRGWSYTPEQCGKQKLPFLVGAAVYLEIFAKYQYHTGLRIYFPAFLPVYLPTGRNLRAI